MIQNNMALQQTIGKYLRDCLCQAYDQGRLCYGLDSCAKLMKLQPDEVMLCVTPAKESGEKDTNNMKHTLLDAFCLEHEIMVFKVESQESLVRLLASRSDTESCNINNNNTMAASASGAVDVITVQYPSGGLSAEDVAVRRYHDLVVLGDTFPKPVIALPD